MTQIEAIQLVLVAVVCFGTGCLNVWLVDKLKSKFKKKYRRIPVKIEGYNRKGRRIA